MKKKTSMFAVLIAAILIVTASCKKNEEEPQDQTFTLTQALLNQATQDEDIGVSGSPYGQDVSIPHNGTTMSPDSTIRDIFSNIAQSASIQPGTVFTKHTYLMNSDGSRGDLQVTFAMFKREAGYNPAGGDFEYVMMPNDGGNDYVTNPNGKLPDVSQTAMRGKLGMCASCHANKSSYIFVR